MQRYKKWCGKVLKCAKKNPQNFLRIDVVDGGVAIGWKGAIAWFRILRVSGQSTECSI